MADTSGKKKGKKKGKTMLLTTFLSNDTSKGNANSVVYAAKPNTSTSWADESEDLPVHGNVSWTDPYAEPKELQRFVLPTAPRSARAGNIDISSIPKGPPYTAFLGNLPYDVDEDDIFHFFQSVQVKDVRLPRESENGRLKGFGYAEFDEMHVFLKALELDDRTLKGRRIRVDVAGQSQGTDKEKDSRVRDQPAESDGDWRANQRNYAPADRDSRNMDYRDQKRGFGNGFSKEERNDDRQWRSSNERRDDYGDRESYGGRQGYDSKDRDGYRSGAFGDKRGGRDGNDVRGYGERDRQGFDERRSYNDRGYGDRDRRYGDRDQGFGDRGFGDRNRGFGDRDRGFGDRDRGYGDRDRGYGDRDRGFGNRDRGYGDRDRGYGDRDRGYGDRDRGYGDRDRGYGDRDRGYGDRDRGYGDRSRGYSDRDRGYNDRDRGYSNRDRGYDNRTSGYGNGDREYDDQSRGFGERDGVYGDSGRGFSNRGREFRSRGFSDKRFGDREFSRDGMYGTDRDFGGERGGRDRPFDERDVFNDSGDRSKDLEDTQDRGDESRPDDKRSGDEPKDEKRAPTERRRLQLQPRTKPKNDDVTTGNETSTSSSAIFGGAKPVDTATKEKEIAARLEKLNSEKESRSVFDGDRRRFKSNSSEDGKRRGSDRSGDSEVSRDGLKPDRGKARGKSPGKGSKREPKIVEPKKFEEPEVKVWAEKSKFSALLVEEDDDVDLESDEDEEKSTETCKTEDSTQEVETKDDNDTEQNKNSQENDREDDAKQC